MRQKVVYQIFPDTVRDFEDRILVELWRGWDVTIEFREPVRLGSLMVAPEPEARTRVFLGSVGRPNPRRRRRG